LIGCEWRGKIAQINSHRKSITAKKSGARLSPPSVTHQASSEAALAALHDASIGVEGSSLSHTRLCKRSELPCAL
jgi:hypothetical protein